MLFPNLKLSCLPLRSEKIILEGKSFGLTPSGTGVFVSLNGYLGLTLGWVEGFEFNLLGAVLGFDIRRPALKFPGIGRLGMTAGI